MKDGHGNSAIEEYILMNTKLEMERGDPLHLEILKYTLRELTSNSMIKRINFSKNDGALIIFL